MHAELVEQDRRQKLRPDEAARRGMERRGRLRDRLAVPAGELLAHRFDHLPPARDLLQRLGDVLAQLRQLAAPQHGQLVGASMTTRSRSMSSGKGLRTGRLRWKERTVCVLCRRSFRRKLVFGRGRLELFQLEFHLIEQPRLAFRARAVERAPQLLD